MGSEQLNHSFFNSSVEDYFDIGFIPDDFL
jgi:hypothetical protein